MLICGPDTPLGNHLVEKALNGGYNVIATSPPLPRQKNNHRAKEPEKKAELERLVLVPWSRQSPVSARNVILRGLSAYDFIDDAIIIHNLTKERRALHELPIAFLQEAIDVQLKSLIFLAKEIIVHFLKRGAGSLSLVVNTEGAEVMSTVDSILTSGFIALTNSLITSYQNESFVINGFDSGSGDAAEYASFVFSLVSDHSRRSSGKWHRHNEKNPFFLGNFRGRGK